VAALAAFASSPSAVLAAGRGKPTWTYPMPAKQKPADPMAQSPGAHVPESPERFVWKTAPRPNVKDQLAVPVFQVSDDGRLTKVGTMPFGQTVTLETTRLGQREHYYGVAWGEAVPGKPRQTAWISGVYIVPAGLAAAGK
jgi:hypothetical protein